VSNCLVVGANGFLGSHVVDKLINDGNFVRAFDRFEENESKYLESEKIERFQGDFLNLEDISAALNDIDFVFHFISTTTPISSEDDPLFEIDTNIRHSVELFQKCVEKKIKKVIFASSGGSVYGNSSLDRIDENVVPNPISPYAIGKLTVEKYLEYFKERSDLHSVVYRISNPYGPRQSLKARQGVIPIFLNRAIRNEPITIHGDGSMVRDYMYVSDVADMVAGSFENATQNLYNIGSGVGVSVSELVETILSTTDKELRTIHLPAPRTFVRKNVLDTSRFQKEFGISPIISLQDGIKSTWEHYLKLGEV
jgi:UDP-glucose 4-epimerase